MLEALEKQRLEKVAKEIRKDIVTMIGVGKAGHLGGSCSLADIVSVLYFHKMNHDPSDPKKKNRDRFLLSKGHAAIVQYAALMESGYFDKEESIHTLKRLGSHLQGLRLRLAERRRLLSLGAACQAKKACHDRQYQ